MEWCLGQRWVLAVMCFLANLTAFMMRSCLSITITEMAKEFDWDERTQGFVLSSFFYGYFVIHVPGGLIADRFGGKYTLGCGVLIMALCTVVTPVFVQLWGWCALVALRVIEGLGSGVTIPAINTLMAQWMPPSVKNRFGAMVFSGVQIGNVVGLLTSGLIMSEPSEWPLPFYIFGSIAASWFLLFIVICYNNPNSHPFISEAERSYLRETNGGQRDINLPIVPWQPVLTSAPVLSLIIIQMGNDYAYFTIATDLPKYMTDVLQFNIHETAISSALPFICMFVTIIAFGFLFDKLVTMKKLTTLQARKTATAIAGIVPGLCMISATYAGYNTTTVVILFTVAMSFKGAYSPIAKINSIDLTPNYAGSIIAVVNGVGALTGVIAPYVVGVLTPNHTLGEWRSVFWITFTVQTSTLIVYLIWGDAEEQWWNDISNYKRSNTDNTEDIEITEASVFIKENVKS